jgi:ATP-dependent helicase HrpB
VVIDEFHERHLHGDVALAILKYLQKSRPDLHLMVMSATLQSEKVSEYLDGAPIYRVESTLYPLKVVHLGLDPRDRTENLVGRSLRHVLQSEKEFIGDILVFLTGQAEIQRAQKLCAEQFGELLCCPLYADLPPAEQALALNPQTRRKIILSTNVAESSLTIEGVQVVIDLGQHRQSEFSSWTGLSQLSTRNICRSSAIQRAGRAARLAPGLCVRTYSEADYNSRLEFEIPEIRRADLSQTCLELLNLKIRDLQNFAWFEAPEASQLEGSLQLLRRLGGVEDDLVDGELQITALGRKFLQIPSHPRWSRALLEAKTLGVLDELAEIASVFSTGKLNPTRSVECHELLNSRDINPTEKRRLIQATPDVQATSTAPAAFSRLEKVTWCLLQGFSDRVGKARGGGQGGILNVQFAAGGSATLEHAHVPGSFAEHLILALDVRRFKDARTNYDQNRLLAYTWFPTEWLFELPVNPITDEVLFSWDSEKRRLSQKSRWRIDNLILEETDTRVAPTPQSVDFLMNKVLKLALVDWPRWPIPQRRHELLRALEGFLQPEHIQSLESLTRRLELYAAHKPESHIAKLIGEDFELWVRVLFREFVKSEEFPQYMENLLYAGDPLPVGISGELESWTPEKIQLGSGRRAIVNYKFDQEPWLESRMQDFFGMKASPTILQGRRPLTLHLLAPNGRAVQVTRDLPGFWSRTYPEVRRELMRRYPRHKWPESVEEIVK